jgi:hypothetical protein
LTRRPAVRKIQAGRAVRSLATVAALVLAVALIGSPAQARDGAVVVSSKIDTEGALLGNMILALLRAHGVAVENKLQLGNYGDSLFEPREPGSRGASGRAGHGSEPGVSHAGIAHMRSGKGLIAGRARRLSR